MLEKEPSGASPDLTQPRNQQVRRPEGLFPRANLRQTAVPNPSDPSHQYTLQFLIAAIKKSSTTAAG